MWQPGVVVSVVLLALAPGLTFTIGSPVASQDSRSKSAAFVFRIEGCPELAKA